MAKLLLPAIFIVLFTLAACANPAPTAVVEPTTISAPTETVAAVGQAEPTPVAGPTKEPTPVPAQTSTSPPGPTATAAPTPASKPEPTPTETPSPTATPTPVPAPTETPTPAPEPTAMVTPAPEPTATQTATPAPTPGPTATSSPTPEPTAIATATPTPTPVQSAAMWRGITVASEDRCSDYEVGDYHYSPSVEPRIVDAQGGIYGPYTGTWFDSIRDTDIEHIVARSEAHDSGLCDADPETRDRFASDILNLTLASPSVNRHQKVAKDPSEWLPDLNECWYVDRVVQVRRKYQLTIDQAEAEAIDRVLAGCESTEMVILAQGPATTAAATPTPTDAPEVDALAMYDDNGNGRITCAEGPGPRHRASPPRAPSLSVHARCRRRRRGVRVGQFKVKIPAKHQDWTEAGHQG